VAQIIDRISHVILVRALPAKALDKLLHMTKEAITRIEIKT
jgi:hypothetical protein